MELCHDHSERYNDMDKERDREHQDVGYGLALREHNTFITIFGAFV